MKRTLLLIIFVGLFLSACGQSEPEAEVAELPTNTVEATATETAVPTDTPTPESTDTPVPTDTPIPTDTPEPTNTPTPTPDPLADYTTFSNAEKQFAMQHPKEWFVLDEPSTGMIMMASDPALLSSDTFDEGTVAFMVVQPSAGVDTNPEQVITVFTSSLDGGLVYDLEPLQEFEDLTVNDQPAGFVAYNAKMVDGDTVVTFFAATVLGSESTAVMFGLSGPDIYEEVGREEVSNILNSVQLDTEITETDLDSVYFVGSYDPERDPAEDVAEAVTLAQEEEKRILLIVGGDWCITCHVLDSYIAANESVAAQLTENFVMLKINFSEENQNEAFLSDYPEIEWYPHFYILESDGTLAESYDTRELETDGLYDDDKFISFLETWSP